MSMQVELGPPNFGTRLPCIVCKQDKPWGIFTPLGEAVCRECRDKSRSFDIVQASLDRVLDLLAEARTEIINHDGPDNIVAQRIGNELRGTV